MDPTPREREEKSIDDPHAIQREAHARIDMAPMAPLGGSAHGRDALDVGATVHCGGCFRKTIGGCHEAIHVGKMEALDAAVAGPTKSNGSGGNARVGDDIGFATQLLSQMDTRVESVGPPQDDSSSD